jgi:molybdate transport system substrate-binding protein
MLPVVLLALAVASGAQAGAASPITVSAAVSLTEVMDALAREWRKAGGSEVSFNFGASNVLARQIVNGAPVDLFVSADAVQMALVEKAGLAAPGTRVSIAGNRLAVVVPAAHAATLSSIRALADAPFRRIAIGDPEAVPAGVYARQYLERVGLWQALQPKLMPAGSVRGALAAVANGAADAAIVYVTDARVSAAVRVAATVSGADAPAIVYPACVVETSRKKDTAAAFLRFLQSEAAGKLFEQYGFQPLTRAD